MSLFADQLNIVGSGQSSLPPPSASKSIFDSSNPTQPQQGATLFGTSTAISQPQQTNSLFGGSTAASQPQQGSSLFGTSSSQTLAPQSQQTGGLFGSQPSQGTAGGLFGTQQSQQPAASVSGANSLTGGLFGSALGQSQAQTQPQQTLGNNLFGGSFTTQNKSLLFVYTETQILHLEFVLTMRQRK